MKKQEDFDDFQISFLAECDARQGSVVVLGYAPECYVAEGLCHAVTAPHVDGQCAQFLFECLRDSTAADDEVAYAAQCFPFFWHLERVPYLQGNHSGKVNAGRISYGCHVGAAERMAAGFYG